MRPIIPFLLFIPMYSSSQVGIYNTELLDSTKQQLYQYVENNLVVRGTQGLGEFKLRSSGSRIESLGNKTFRIYTSHPGNDTIKVYLGEKLIHTSVFQIHTLPIPVATVGGYLDSLFSINDILLTPYLSILFPGSNYRGQFYVHGFLMEVQYQTGELSFYETGDSNRLSTRQLEIIKALRPGDRLYFSDIIGGGPDSRLQKLASFTIIIK